MMEGFSYRAIATSAARLHVAGGMAIDQVELPERPGLVIAISHRHPDDRCLGAHRNGPRPPLALPASVREVIQAFSPNPTEKVTNGRTENSLR